MAGKSSFADMSSDERAAFADRIKQAASRLDTQEAAAVAAGVSLTQLKNWFSGASAPSLLAVARLALASGVDLRWVAYGKGEMLAAPRDPEKEKKIADPALAEVLRVEAMEAQERGEPFEREFLPLIDAVYREEGVPLSFKEAYDVGIPSCWAILDVIEAEELDRELLIAIAIDSHRSAIRLMLKRSGT